MLFGPDNMPLKTPEGTIYMPERNDIFLLTIVWRGSKVMMLTNREAIKRFSFDDKRKISDTLHKIFEQDFGVLL